MINDLKVLVDTSNNRDDGYQIEMENDKKNTTDYIMTENFPIEAKSLEQILPSDFNHQDFLLSGFSFVSEEERIEYDDVSDATFTPAAVVAATTATAAAVDSRTVAADNSGVLACSDIIVLRITT